MSYDEIRENMFGVSIYYDELKYTYISETAAIDSASLVSNIGGTLGLFLGMSILSFVEVIELVIELFYYIYNKNESK